MSASKRPIFIPTASLPRLDEYGKRWDAELREAQAKTADAFAQFDQSLAAAEAALSDMRAIIAAGKGAA